MSWLPVLVLVTIVDRNPVAPEVIRQQLNDFVEDVRCALLSSRLRDSYMTETHRRKGDFAWTASVDFQAPLIPSITDMHVDSGSSRTRFSVGTSSLNLRAKAGCAGITASPIQSSLVLRLSLWLKKGETGWRMRIKL